MMSWVSQDNDDSHNHITVKIKGKIININFRYSHFFELTYFCRF